MATLLKNLEIDEISFVDAGANQHARVLLYKRAPVSAVLVPLLARIAKEYATAAAPMSFDEAVMARSIDEISDECGTYLWALRDSLTSILQSDTADKAAQMRASLAQFTTALDAVVGDWFDTEDVAKTLVTKRGKTLTAEQRAVLASFRHTLAALVPKPASVVPPKENESMDTKADLTKLSPAAQAVLKALGLTELPADQVAAFEASLPKAPEPEPKPEDVLKGLEPAAKKFVEKAMADATAAAARVTELQAVVKAEQNKIAIREFIAKAQTLDALPGMNADDFGVVLKGMAEKAPEEWAKLEPMLKSAHAAIKTGALYVEKGRGGGGEGGGSPFDRATAMAREKVAKNLAKTEVDALADVWRENPSLYAEYRNEMATRISGRSSE